MAAAAPDGASASPLCAEGAWATCPGFGMLAGIIVETATDPADVAGMRETRRHHIDRAARAKIPVKGRVSLLS